MNNQNYNHILEQTKMKIALKNFSEESTIKKNNYKKYSSNLIITLVACIIISSITYASIQIKNIFGDNSSEGVSTASNNNYIFNYTDNTYIESQGVLVKIDSFLIDDFNLAINFNFTFNNNLANSNIIDIWICDLKVIDEENITVFGGNLEESGYKGGYSYLTSCNNEIYTVSFSSPSNKAYPRSKLLNISFSTIKIDPNTDIDGDETYISGSWNFSIKVPDIMYNRKTLNYTVKNCNDKNTVVKNATLSITALKFDLTTTSDKINFDTARNHDLPINEKEPIYRRIYRK